MKNLLFFCVFLLFFSCSKKEKLSDKNIVTSDITNFYQAFDKINTSKDSVVQMDYLQKLFINKASEGQKAMFAARRYKPEEYLHAIKAYPKFWSSIRPNMFKAMEFATTIRKGVIQFNDLYAMKQKGKVYFTVGVFRSPGTTLDSMVLIGSEFALGDKQVVTEEFPENMQYAIDYYANNPINDIVFLNVHEFVHTQQKTATNAHLLTQSMREGVAEFIAEKATGEPSKSPALAFGKQNSKRLKSVFAQEMFNYDYTYWLWSNADGPFDIRDLAYYMGYSMVYKYYQEAENKQEALKILIELDYEDDLSIENFVDKLKYFDRSMSKLKDDWDASRPYIIQVEPFDLAEPKLGKHTCIAHFSEAMNTYSRGFDFGPLGEDHVLGVEKVLGYDEDQTSFSWTVNMLEKKQYQVFLTEQFTNKKGMPLKRHLIDVDIK